MKDIKDHLTIDPRTKLFLILVTNIVMVNMNQEGAKFKISMILFIILILLLVQIKKYKVALISSVLYFAAIALTFTGWLAKIPPFINLVASVYVYSITKTFPCFLSAYYLLKSTEVSALLLAFRKMHIPERLNLPLAVVFRFIPNVGEENREIANAMNIRGLNLSSGISIFKILEYKYIPLIFSTVKAGEDLTISAMTKGLSTEDKRTSIRKIRFSFLDYVFVSILIVLLFIFFGGKS
ncbi:MAG: energy-coupling factor transporter transmembrane protein EcfT [Epulopiscium sp.]|nr:energy-coupling factor transporter transmembrane protein EcfT [Candidatus Epulonipiscium sp.]